MVNTDLCSAAQNPELFLIYKDYNGKICISEYFLLTERKLNLLKNYISEDSDQVIEEREKSRRDHLYN